MPHMRPDERKTKRELIAELRRARRTIDSLKNGWRKARQLQASNNLSRTVVSSLPGGAVFIFNTDLRYIFAEGEFFPQYEITRQDLVDKTMEECFPPDMAESIVPHCRRILEGENVYFEFWLEDHIFSNHGTPIRNLEGEITAGLVVVFDITEQRRTMDALRLSEERFRTYVENASDIIYSLSLDRRIEYVSPNWKNMLGHDPDTIIGKYIQEMVHPDDAESCDAVLARLAATGQPGTGHEYRVRRLNGLWRWHRSHANLLKNKQGRVIGFIGIARDITEQRETLEALRHSEERFRNYVESAHDLIFCITRDNGQLEYVSPNSELLLGHKPGDVLGMNFVRFLHPEDVATCEDALREMLLTGEARSGVEYRVRHKDGSWRWQLTNASPIKDRQGRVSGYVGIARDITEQRLDAERLSESERHLRIIFENSPLGMIRFDHQGVIVDCNNKFAELMGSSRERLIGFNTAERSNPAMRRTLRLALDGQVAVYEDEYLSVTGGKKSYLRVIFNPIHPESPPTGVIATLEEVTERKLAEQALLESEKRLRSILENVSNIAIQGYDHERRVIYWNDASAELYGYSREEVLGSQLEDLIIPEAMRPAVVADIQAWIRDGVPIPAGELLLRHKDGSEIPVFSSHVLHRNSLGELEMYCIDVDLSTVKAMQKELIMAKERAEAASMAKTEFLANMSHELRTPLNGIIGMLQLIRATSLNDEQIAYADVATQSGKRLTGLLGDILDLSRIEAGRMPINEADFSLREVVSGVVDLFAPTARQGNIVLSFLIDKNAPDLLKGDEQRLRQILANLVGNAVKFTMEGRVRIEVSRLPSPTSEPRLLFQVSDTGIGIADEVLHAMFEPFTQGRGEGGAYSRRFQGAGLGLTITRRLVDMLGGGMSVDSTLGRGASFYVSLPFRAGEAMPIKQTLRQATSNLGVSGRVLMVEDDAVNRMATRRILEKCGLKVEEAETAEQALELFQHQDYDLVLMDIQLPGMDGVQATRIIRGEPQFKSKSKTPIIAVTAYAMSGDRETFLQAGMDAYLAKPLEAGDLLDTIRNFLA